MGISRNSAGLVPSKKSNHLGLSRVCAIGLSTKTNRGFPTVRAASIGSRGTLLKVPGSRGNARRFERSECLRLLASLPQEMVGAFDQQPAAVFALALDRGGRIAQVTSASVRDSEPAKDTQAQGRDRPAPGLEERANRNARRLGVESAGHGRGNRRVRMVVVADTLDSLDKLAHRLDARLSVGALRRRRLVGSQAEELQAEVVSTSAILPRSNRADRPAFAVDAVAFALVYANDLGQDASDCRVGRPSMPANRQELVSQTSANNHYVLCGCRSGHRTTHGRASGLRNHASLLRRSDDRERAIGRRCAVRSSDSQRFKDSPAALFERQVSHLRLTRLAMGVPSRQGPTGGVQRPKPRSSFRKRSSTGRAARRPIRARADMGSNPVACAANRWLVSSIPPFFRSTRVGGGNF